jgi:hypothetical protein
MSYNVPSLDNSEHIDPLMRLNEIPEHVDPYQGIRKRFLVS